VRFALFVRLDFVRDVILNTRRDPGIMPDNVRPSSRFIVCDGFVRHLVLFVDIPRRQRRAGKAPDAEHRINPLAFTHKQSATTAQQKVHLAVETVHLDREFGSIIRPRRMARTRLDRANLANYRVVKPVPMPPKDLADLLFVNVGH